MLSPTVVLKTPTSGREDPLEQLGSTLRRQSDILMDVHPGRLLRVSDVLAKISLSKTSRMDNLLSLHT